MIRMWTVSIVAMLVALCSKAHADTTDVSGTLNTNAWTVAFSPYRVTGNTTVPTGETLTIQPGVEHHYAAEHTRHLVHDSTPNARELVLGELTDPRRFAISDSSAKRRRNRPCGSGFQGGRAAEPRSRR